MVLYPWTHLWADPLSVTFMLKVVLSAARAHMKEAIAIIGIGTHMYRVAHCRIPYRLVMGTQSPIYVRRQVCTPGFAGST